MDKTVIGLFQSQTQIDLLRDELNNEGIPTDTLSIIGQRVKFENATSNPNARSQIYRQIISSGSFHGSSYQTSEQISDELAGFGIEREHTSTYADKIFHGGIGVVIRVNEDQARVASGRFRNTGGKYVKIQ
jgi:hypothetical protein